MNKNDSKYTPYPTNKSISKLASEILERGDHEILENLEKNKDNPAITKLPACQKLPRTSGRMPWPTIKFMETTEKLSKQK